MKVFGTEISLSRDPRRTNLAKAKAPSRADGKEQGTAGSKYDNYFNNELSLSGVRNPSIRQIMDMLDNDGTMAGLYSVVTYPMLALDWHIEPDPEDLEIIKNADGTTTELHPQADFVDKCLRDPLHKGGMSTPFSLVIADIALGVAQGYRFFEIVYKINDDGLYVFQKVIARDYNTFTIRTDETGGFDGVDQTVTRNNKTESVHIELPYSFLFTYRKDRNKLKGMSAFRAAFYHYDKKHRLYFLANQQGQQAAVNPKVLEEPEDNSNVTEEDRAANLAAVDAMAVRSSIRLPFGWKLDIKDPGRGIDLAPYIDHHDTAAARSVLAQMMMLGTMSDSKGGSYGLSESQTSLFMLQEKALLGTVEEHITSFLISKLISINFEKPLYPTFKFNDLSDSMTVLLTEAFKAIVSKGTVPQWISDAISEKVAQQMDLVKPEDADEPVSTKVEQSRKKKESRLAKSEWWRELTAAEAKVQFNAIQKKADTEEEKLVADLKPVFDKVSSDATKRLKPLLEKDGAKALDGFELKYGDEMRKVMSDHMLEVYTSAKNGAADELKVKAPANKTTSKDLITQHAQAIVDKQFSDLLFNTKTIVTDAIRKNLLDKTELSVGEVIAKIAAMFALFFDEKEELTATSLLTTALNIGRDDVFQAFSNKIYAYQYSAILDDVVCPICEDLDSSVVDEATYYATIWMPPIHFNCRCIWVAIMNDEQDKPDFKDIPDSPGGADAPSLAKVHTHGDQEYGIYLSNKAREIWHKRQH